MCVPFFPFSAIFPPVRKCPKCPGSTPPSAAPFCCPFPWLTSIPPIRDLAPLLTFLGWPRFPQFATWLRSSLSLADLDSPKSRLGSAPYFPWLWGFLRRHMEIHVNIQSHIPALSPCHFLKIVLQNDFCALNRPNCHSDPVEYSILGWPLRKMRCPCAFHFPHCPSCRVPLFIF